ncbi:MAG: glucosaminidase domain-containing protein [Bacteroidales bacterium]|nr:glucosaminidase domain-containing protein [Bacteroidales bacterium]MDZ4203707.1 glucosaminidase domain-containing protein [Bacteroidales bacterium]
MKKLKTKLLTLASILIALLTIPYYIDAQEITRQEYIERFAPIAKQKMREYRIPSSISLAQGLLESGSGNSRLAREANNHFGIKCHREWTGETFLYDDDTKNECFRKYLSPEESYHDHSLFLIQRPRYAELFKLDILDYNGWAHGLKQAGYATSPNYAQHLIRVIEENRLYLVDQEVVNEHLVIAKVLIQHQEKPDVKQMNRNFQKFSEAPYQRTIYLNNKKLFVFARTNDSWFSIAKDFDMKMMRLLKINDHDNHNHQLCEGSMVYLQCKRARSAEKPHHVQHGESLHSIAQLYGVRLRNLARNNGIHKNSQLNAGEVIKLK